MKPSYEELEARCAALAAERDIVNADNAYLRDQIMCCARECDRITYTHTNKVTDAHQREAERDLANTFPDNSAFLAEVRAQGVETAIDTAKNVVAQEFQYKDFQTAQRVCHKFPESDLVGKIEMVEWLEEFAAQIRKGVQS